MSLAVSIVIATYASGDGLERLLASLDAQSMPADQFEVIFVDDGSPDDTVARLRQLTATRPNTTVIELDHTGWPGRPRNVGTDAARGEYVLFMDHDDTLYPDALRRGYEFAREHGSDVVNPKESMTSDVWWASDSMSAGNLADIHRESGIRRLQELTPHKLYRRTLLSEHGIRFPETRRALWEDWYVNVPAYRHADVVSVLADTPFYQWHITGTNTTRTFDCANEDYWDRLTELFELITSTLVDERFDQDRLELLAYNVRLRVIQRVARLVNRREQPSPASVDMAFARARVLLERYGTPDVLARMSNKHLAFAHLFREGTAEQVRALEVAERSIQVGAELAEQRWDGDRLLLDVATTWRATQPSLARFVEEDARLRLDLGPELSAAIPPQLLDLTDELEHMSTELAVRDRFGHVSWQLPFVTDPPAIGGDSTLGIHLVQRGHGVLNLTDAACGRPLPDAVWDLRLRANWYGIERKPALGCRPGRVAAAIGSRAAISYRNKWHNFTLDLAQELRTLALDAAPVAGQLGPISGFSTPLSNLHATGFGRIDSKLVVVAEADAPAGGAIEPDRQTHPERLAQELDFAAEIVADEHGARLCGHGALPPGDYRLYAHQRSGLSRSDYVVTVNPAGGAQLIISRT